MTEQQLTPDRAVRAGLVVVGTAAAVMSFTALSDLARLMGITATVGWPGGPTVHVAWLLPVVVDVLAAVSTKVWLRRLGGPDAARFAQRAAWGAIGATVGGNAYHGYLTGHGAIDVVVVAAVPAIVFGTIVHLGMLVGRPVEDPAVAQPTQQAVTAWDRLLEEACAEDWVRAWTTWRRREEDSREGGAEDGPTREELALPDPPDRSEPDEVLVADLRVVDALLREVDQPSPRIDGVRKRYKVGATRAERLRREADRPAGPPAEDATPPAARPHLVRDDQEAAV